MPPREPKGHTKTPAGERELTPGNQNADGTRSAQGCLNRTGLADAKSLRTAGKDYAKLTNSALRCKAQTGRARVLAVVLRDISRNLKFKRTSLRIRWLDTRPWVRRPCLRGLRQRPFTPHPSQLRYITNMVHNVKGDPPRERGGIAALRDPPSGRHHHPLVGIWNFST